MSRPRPDLAKYKMLQHGPRVRNQFINPLIRTASHRFPQDGVTTCHFRVVSSSTQALFTHFLIDVGQPSYSVLEPNLHLESLITGASPSPAQSLSASSQSTEVKSREGNHISSHHHHPYSSAGGDDYHHHRNQKQKRSSPGDTQFHHYQFLVTSIPEHSQDSSKTGADPQQKVELGDNESMFPILSGIARDTTDNTPHHLKENSLAQQQLQHQSQQNKPDGKMVKAGPGGKARQARSLSQSLSKSSSSAVPVPRDDRKEARKVVEQDNSEKPWLSLQMTPEMMVVLKEKTKGSKPLSLILSVGINEKGTSGNSDGPDIALDPDVPVMPDDEDDLDDGADVQDAK